MPMVPLLPVCSVVINTGLLITFKAYTWLRLVGWVAIGESSGLSSETPELTYKINY